MPLFNEIAAKMPLFVPTRGKQGVFFAPWKADADLGSSKTTLSPKGFFLPMVEGLYTSRFAQTEHGDMWHITPTELPDQPFALLGVHACDVAALNLLDNVFLAQPADPQYQARRTAAHMITVPCQKRCASCFCDAFGIDPMQPGGDVTLCLDNNTWQAHTPKGEALTAAWTQDLIHATTNYFSHTNSPGDEIMRTNHLNETQNNLPVSVLTDFETRFFGGDNPVITSINALALFNAPAWDTLHHTCIACGTCAFLCPTCQCYDIHTQTEHCHRHWDTCLNTSFTQMAHGNPRPSKKERFRQRYMHKLVYFKQRYGVFGCVGCGRCAEYCPAGINPVDVARTLCEM